MSSIDSIPIVILAGSDSEPAQLPLSGAGKHPLRGPKALQIILGGQPLIDLLIERLREVDAFGPVFVAGPHLAYGTRRGGVEVIDTDGSFGENLRAAVEAVRERCPGRPIAFTACDILPAPEEMDELLVDYHTHRPLDFWFPVILAPRQRELLGASAWKPQYGIVPNGGGPARPVLPGHLVIVDPDALRLGFIYRSFELAYRSRNRSLVYRFFFVVAHLLMHLLGKDLRQLLRLRPPVVTVSAVYQAMVIVAKERGRTMTTEELARRFRAIYVRSEHRRRHPERRGRLPLMAALSLAKDMDTQEEAEELARDFEPSEAGGVP